MVVNDRSTDGTSEILQRATNRHPQISVLDIEELPLGWLGKNNALYQGYKHTDEEWLLFTDADIVYHPDALSKAMNYAVTHQLDYLTIFPHLESRSAILNSVFATFGIMLKLHLRPWAAKDPKSKASAGIGAFIMIKREAYQKAGTHERIRLRPDDDLQLGKSVKAGGFKMDVLKGLNYVSLEWYKNLYELQQGLLKNAFSVSQYSVGVAIINILMILVSIALPVPLMLIFGTTAIRLMAVASLLAIMVYMVSSPPNKWWHALMVPFSGFFMAYVISRAVVITLKQGGIYWRGSFYSLAELRKAD